MTTQAETLGNFRVTLSWEKEQRNRDSPCRGRRRPWCWRSSVWRESREAPDGLWSPWLPDPFLASFYFPFRISANRVLPEPTPSPIERGARRRFEGFSRFLTKIDFLHDTPTKNARSSSFMLTINQKLAASSTGKAATYIPELTALTSREVALGVKRGERKNWEKRSRVGSNASGETSK